MLISRLIKVLFGTGGFAALLLLTAKNAPDDASKPRLRRHLLLRDSHGTIKLDYYRTYETKTFLFIFRWKSYSISRAGISSQLAALNVWFDGRVKFVRGDVFDYDGPHENVDAFRELTLFADPTSRNLGRISVLVVKSFVGQTVGVALTDIPLGGAAIPTWGDVAPALAIMSGRGSFPTSFGDIGTGVAHVTGATLAHEVGHVLGFQHTSLREPGFVYPYSGCGLDLRYPRFGEDNEVPDGVTGEVYHHDDWKGRTNLMTTFGAAGVLDGVLNLELGIYKFNYEPIFDQITQCWFERSSSFVG